jgi:hypothetical protein
MVVAPSKHLKIIPHFANKIAAKLFKRWIAADQKCDSDAEPMTL